MKHSWIVLLLMAGQLWAEPTLSQLIEEGNAAFDRADFEAALEHYDDALEAAPKVAVLFYNKGNVLYRQQQFDAAIEAYQSAIRNKPKKRLQRNIHFNLGNVYFRQAKAKLAAPETSDDEEPESPEAAATSELDRLNAALLLLEQASSEYRRSLELDRKISIVEGRDLHNSGVYAKKNWALTRQAWTDTQEKIRRLQRQNQKLRDGVDELRRIQAVNLPRLEDVYLRSFSQDALDYRLKVLAEFQIDNQESIKRLRGLASKEVERINAEVENHKAAAAAADPPPPEDAEDAELARLEQELDHAAQIYNAISGTAGFENFVIDAMKRGKPMPAWRNLKAMVELLDDLVVALDRQDPVREGYSRVIADLHSIDGHIRQARSLQQEDADSPHGQMGGRSRVLAGEKLGNLLAAEAEEGQEKPGALERIDMVLDHLSEAQTPPAPAAEGAEPSPVALFFQRMPSEIMKAAITEAKSLNAKSREALEASHQAVTGDTELADDLSLQETIEETEQAMTLVLTAQRPIADLLTSILGEVDALEERLQQVDIAEQDLELAQELPLLDVLRFEYGVIVEQAQAEEAAELEQVKTVLSSANAKFIAALGAFNAAQESVEDLAALKKLTTSVDALRAALFGALLALDPNRAVLAYFDRLGGLQERLQARLPSAEDKMDKDREHNLRFFTESQQLADLLQQVVDMQTEAQPEDGEPPHLQAQRRSLAHVQRLTRGADKALQFLAKDSFVKRDFLVKDLDLQLQKGKLAFQQQPQDAAGALRLGIEWQERLQTQNTDASSIAVQIGQDKELGAHMGQNQADIGALAGQAATMVREQIESAAQTPQGQGPAPHPQPAPPNTDNLEQAITAIQDAIVEADAIKGILDQAEFHNAQDKHGGVIAHLTKALELLENPEDQEQQDDQQGDQNQDQQNDQQQQQASDSPQRQMTPELARQLLNELNNKDRKDQPAKAKAAAGTVNTPRPW